MKPNNIILEGLCGSKAYGLDTEASDEDWKGIYAKPTDSVLGLERFKGKDVYDHVAPDWCYYELSKYIGLAMKCNPTVTELLWLDNYSILTDQGKKLVSCREMFLSTSYVRNAYGGYVFSQARKLNAQGGYGNGRNARYKKHSRHLFRLLLQGRELLETGHLTVRVTQEQRDMLFSMQELSVDKLISRFEFEIKELDTVESILPEEPNYWGINEMLLKLRKENI